MEKRNYDNALTSLEEKNFKKDLESLLESIEKLNNLENNKVLTENQILLEKASWWDKIKYQIGKIGRYKAGGKIFGKGKVDQEWATKITRIIDKKGNESIKELDTQIKVANSKGKGEFPNNQDPDIFLGIVESIAAVYDSIVAATKLKPEEKGFLPIDAANAIIEDMRTYVKKYLDVDLRFTGSIFDSEEEKDELITDEVDVNEDRSKDVRKKLKSKVGADAEKIDSERMKTLKSWKLPLALLGAGASFGALSWLIHYLFDPQEITTMSPEEITSATQEGLGNIQPGEGMTQIMNRTLGMDLSPSSDPNDVVSALSKIGGGDPQAGVDIITQKGGIFADPAAAKSTLSELVANPNAHGDNLGQVFKGTWAGTGQAAGDTLVTVPGGTLKGMIIRSVIKWVSKKTVVGGSKLLIAAPILKVLGIGLFGAGIVVKLMREKGKRQSRAATLNDLLQSLQLVKPQEGNEPILPTPVIDEPTGGEEQPTGGEEQPTGGEEQPTGGKEQPPVTTDIPADFLKGNRNMQLVYLSQNFLPGGKSLWARLGLKEGTVLPTGFFDAALGQGKVDQEKYLNAFYKHLEKEDSFTKKLNVGAWLAKVQSNENQALIKWVRNTRKSIGGFIGAIKKAFPEFEIGERRKAKTKRPGERGKAMALAGESIMGKNDLLIEIGLGGTASKAGFDEKEFMKNLPQFMEMLSMMYYDGSGKSLPYNKEEVLSTCKEFGCKAGSSKKYKKTKSDDYEFMMSDELINEDIKRIRQLMK